MGNAQTDIEVVPNKKHNLNKYLVGTGIIYSIGDRDSFVLMPFSGASTIPIHGSLIQNSLLEYCLPCPSW